MVDHIFTSSNQMVTWLLGINEMRVCGPGI